MPVVSVPEINARVDAVLRAAGVPEAHVEPQRLLLVDAELRGIASHGLLRLPRIVERIGNGVTDPRATGVHDWTAPGVVKVDGQGGLGPVIALNAIAAIAERAKTQGIALAAVTRSDHIGMLGFYADRFAESGQILIALSTSEALVHPWGGRRAMLGTNPIAIGMPTGDGIFMMDTATSMVSMGEVHNHADRGVPIPLGWALDAEGNPTTDAVAARSGAIAPFGGAKGYALGLAFELLATSLAGAAIGRDVVGTLDSDKPCNKADLFIVIDQAMSPVASYLEALRAETPAEGFDGVRIPGERGRELRARAEREGASVADVTWSKILALPGASEALS
jgi:L-2-hydroxycarboxylate dehydrogenase (NAD+)